MNAAKADNAELAAPQPAPRRRPGRAWRTLRRNGELLTLSLPAMLLLFLFAYAPLPGLVLAFKKYNFTRGILGSEWVGFRNFRFFFASQDAFVITRNTILYNLTFIVLTTVIAVALAILFKEISRGWIKIHQTILFLPYFLSFVAVSYVALSLFDYGDGITHASGYVNKVLALFGHQPIQFYFEAQYWPFILTSFQLWKGIGFATLIYFAGLLGIDPSYYEAAGMDGASKWQMIRHITIPLLTPLVLILFIVALGGIFRSDFGLFYFIPNDSSFLYAVTDVIDTYIYRSLLRLNDTGMSTAIGLFQSTVGFLTVVGANAIIRKINDENSLW
ncbi:ABC transporter permease [Paenibacillus cymbidii]|uniref:ABC transporter permease n=1 Tax=Paenibacillus cymbidii TaxID=1639034 RepID=UPI0010821530|nr:ABC transporter permease subunit [Paenibacillus cymbidii]